MPEASLHPSVDSLSSAGIDIDGSTDVEIAGCRIRTADDAICLKTTHPGHPTERVRVAGCSLKSRSSAVKLGSESRAGFRDISFRNLKARGPLSHPHAQKCAASFWALMCQQRCAVSQHCADAMACLGACAMSGMPGGGAPKSCLLLPAPASVLSSPCAPDATWAALPAYLPA